MAERLAPEKRHSFVHGGKKVFEWDQTLEEVNMYIPLPPGNLPSKLFYCNVQAHHIVVGVRGSDRPYLDHDLAAPVKTDSSFWTLGDGTMHVNLQKREKGHTWPSPIQGQGLLDPYSADLEQKRLMLQRFQEEERERSCWLSMRRDLRGKAVPASAISTSSQRHNPKRRMEAS